MSKGMPLYKISVIIPTYNSANVLRSCLQALLNVDYPLKLIEVIIVDSNSQDDTHDIVKDFMIRYKDKLSDFKFIITKLRGLSRARNIGTKHAKGDFIFFLDSDVIVPPNIFNLLLEHFVRDQRIAVAGMPYLSERLTMYEKALYFRYPRPYGYVQFVDMGATLVRASIARKISFNEKLGIPYSTWESTEYCAKILRQGYKIVCDTRALCKHIKAHSKSCQGSSKSVNPTLRLFTILGMIKYYFAKVGPANLEVLKVAPRKWILKTTAYITLPLITIVLSYINPLFTFLLLVPIIYHYIECKLGTPLEKLIISMLVITQRIIVSYATLLTALKQLMRR